MATPDIDLGTFDFDTVHQETRDRNAPPVRDVPPNLVALAQKSWDDQTEVTFSFRKEGPAFATKFAETMKFAGDHTSPQTTVVVTHEVNSIVVKFVATVRRGRRPDKKDGADK